MADVRQELDAIGDNVRARFEAQRRVLSFDEYLELVARDPYSYTRDAARYLHGCLLHFGSYEVDGPLGKGRRFRVFDLDFGHGDGEEPPPVEARRSDHLVGHEAIQQAVFRTLAGFVREGRANRLILLHGPNGSAKSTFVSCLMRGLEAYSATEAGALYRFSWIFPNSSDGRTLGFGSRDDRPKEGESYAHLPEERVQVKLPSETREHPLQLLPVAERRTLLERLYAEANVRKAPPDWLWSGQLSHKNRQIFEALLTAYRGDLSRVLAHVQVERYYVSRKYRQAAVTIGPQMAVDASERQVTSDHLMNRLPASLSALTLFEPFGELVDASGGVVEYSDLLKRPLDAWKYLLMAIENGEVSLKLSSLAINSVMLASSNELHLGAFKEHPEYHSFRGRIAFVRVPYLLDYREEQGIYDAQILPQVSCHVAPHTTYVAGLWAVLTRLRAPKKGNYEDTRLGAIAETLSPHEKAELYASGNVPSRLSTDDAKALRAGREVVFQEHQLKTEYEGLIGASPRELRSLLLDLATEVEDGCLSPRDVFQGLDAFCNRSDYEFLRQSPDGGYYDHRGFIGIVREAWLDRVETELRDSSGLVEEGQYVELFEKYISHASNWVKNEKVYNPVTGKHEDPDLDLMERVEGKWRVEDPAEFRKGLLGTVANYVIEHPDDEVVYANVFPRLIDQLESAYFEEHRKELASLAEGLLAFLDEDETIEPGRRAELEEVLGRLKERHGYESGSARIALGELLDSRLRA